MTDEDPVARTPREMRDVIAAERTGEAFLLWRGAGGDLQIVRLGEDRWRLTVGRGADADVALSHDSQVSRVHALLERAGEQWTLLDDGLSHNGSFVNTSRLVGRHRLADRDRLRFGSTEVRFRAASTRDAMATLTSRETISEPTLSPMQRRVLIALCRPVHEAESATPATNRAIAAEVFLSVDAVKAHLRVLFDRFGLGELPQNEKRARLAAAALVSGALTARDF